jgi:endonuclease III related protein
MMSAYFGASKPAPDELFCPRKPICRLKYMDFSKQPARQLRLRHRLPRHGVNSTEDFQLRDTNKENEIRAYYQTLFRAWGPQHWWPAQSRFEVIVGAYLTQNTAWTNVEKAMANLRAARVLTVSGVRRTSLAELEQLVRPAGYFRQKAMRLKLFVAFLDRRYKGSLEKLFARPTEELREELLSLNGIGPETADSILLYAGNHPVFVVDAYTRRILARHEVFPEEAAYEEVRTLFQQALAPVAESAVESAEQKGGKLAAGFAGASHPPSAMSAATRTALAQVYNEMHGLIVGVGKNYCRKSQARCDQCPLQPFLPRV